MQFTYTLFALSFAVLSVAYPVSKDVSLATAAIVDRDIATIDLKNLATTKATTSTTKASAKAPTAAQVKTASANFAKDAKTVSASINTMGDTTDAKTLKSLATKAFAAESDEDAQRSVLAAAAGDAGSSSNSKIVKNTPAVLTGLQNIMDDPTTATATKNLAAIQKARNPNILPSITQLSNAALDATGQDQTQQKFPVTTA